MTHNRHKPTKMTSENAPLQVPSVRVISVKAFGKDTGKPVDVKLRGIPVTWGIPMDETVFSLWFSNFVHLPVMPWDSVAITMSTYLPSARNYIHDKFLDNGTSEWLVMLDSDVLPPPDFLDRLLSHNKKMVGGWYKLKGGMHEPVVYDYGDKKDLVNYWKKRTVAGKGLEKVDAAGAGCWLMHRDVAQAIGHSPYDMETGGEDLSLCLKVHAAGFDTWIDWDVACAHAGVAYT